MKTVIHKYVIANLDANSEVKVTIPGFIGWVSVGFQGYDTCLWALRLAGSTEPVTKTIGVYGTGHLIPESVRLTDYIGAAHHPKMQLVLHFFDIHTA